MKLCETVVTLAYPLSYLRDMDDKDDGENDKNWKRELMDLWLYCPQTFIVT